MQIRKYIVILGLLSLFFSFGYANSSLVSSEEKYINSILDESNATQERKDMVEALYYTLLDYNISLDKIKNLEKYLTWDIDEAEILKEFNVTQDSEFEKDILSVIDWEEPTFDISEADAEETKQNYADADKNYADAKQHNANAEIYDHLSDVIDKTLWQ